MPAEVVVRPVRPEEYQAVGDITIAAYLTIAGFSPGERYQAEMRDVAARVESAEVLVAAGHDGRVLGAVTFVPGLGPMAEFDGPDESGMRMLAVDPAAQGRGVGAALLRRVLDASRERGKGGVVCSSLPQMRAAHRVYERAGFHRAPGRDWSPVAGVELLAFVTPLGAPVSDRRAPNGV
jgi:ribosomal protein S18 acetylase RimI-like enzyme